MKQFAVRRITFRGVVAAALALVVLSILAVVASAGTLTKYFQGTAQAETIYTTSGFAWRTSSYMAILADGTPGRVEAMCFNTSYNISCDAISLYTVEVYSTNYYMAGCDLPEQHTTDVRCSWRTYP
jgi:hypothetical protein